MATLENIFMTVCIWGLIIVLDVTFIAIAVVLIGLVRHPGCHSTCEKYLAEKAAHDKRKAELDRESRTSAAIYIARGNQEEKAMRKRRAFKR